MSSSRHRPASCVLWRGKQPLPEVHERRADNCGVSAGTGPAVLWDCKPKPPPLFVLPDCRGMESRREGRAAFKSSPLEGSACSIQEALLSAQGRLFPAIIILVPRLGVQLNLPSLPPASSCMFLNGFISQHL